MKNLFKLGERRRRLNVASCDVNCDSLIDLCFTVTESDSRTATVALTQNGIVSRINSDGEVVWTRHLQDLEPSCANDGWFNLTYVDPELVCLCKNGAMVAVDPTTGDAELVGAFDYGLEAAAWSPDGEVLLMVTSAADDDDESKTKSVLMTMNAQFEVMTEITIPTYVASSAADDARVNVAWRPDGTLCAMSAVDAEDGTRKVRIFKRETLELHAIGRSEDASGAIVKNLQDSGLSWASTGCSQLLAAVQRKGKKQQVAFFESNGLRHREFALREAPSTIVTFLTWNVVADLLAVALREEDGTDKVQLWHRCNYHWYMKQEIRYPNQSIQSVKFNEERSHEFSVVLKGLDWYEYQVRWDPSTTLPVDDQCPAFVVDGCSLNITRLGKALIPPPMFMINLTMAFPINDICFCHGTANAGSLLVQLSNGDIVFLSRGNNHTSYNMVKITWEDVMGVDWRYLRSFLVVGGLQDQQINVVAVAPALPNCESETLVEILISDFGASEAMARVTKTTTLEDVVLRMVNWSDNDDGCLVQLTDGAFLEYEISEEGSLLQPSSAEPLLEPCPWVCAIKDSSRYAGQYHAGHSKMVFGLSARSRLYFHDVMLTDSASSFYLSISHEFLCYATNGSRCFLRFLPLKEINGFDPLMGMDQNHLLEGYEPRSVERGARVVAILPTQPMAVLQMPRGNLEGVCPRALVLRFVMLQIAQGQYGQAFTMMRQHKVDLNLLVDFDPWLFCETGITNFFRQISDIDHLNLFLSGLQDWDITQSRFPVPTWLRRENLECKPRSTFDFSTKVNHICRKSRATMSQMEQSGEKIESYYLLPILSTFAKESPPKLDQALGMIKERALQQHPSDSKKPPLFGDKAQNAIHYLAFLAEYELLFETALGMYDFEIARAVARNSQMDPKVYLPLLKRLNSLPLHYAKYEVDVRLKRFDPALKNLVESNNAKENLEGFSPTESDNEFGNSFENCMLLIEKHKLHKIGLGLFQSDREKFRTVLISLGVTLLDERKSEAALSVFLAADPPAHIDAKKAAMAAGDWKTFFTLPTSEITMNGATSEEAHSIALEQRRQVARDIAKEMIAQKLTPALNSKQDTHSHAARVLLDYGDDIIGAVDMLVSAECWGEAHRIAVLHSRLDLVKKCTDGAIEYAHVAMDDFLEKSSTFKSTTSRYNEVLSLRKKNVFDEGPAYNEADETGSLFSAASNISNMSLQSATSTGSGVSSIISIKSSTTFTMTGGEDDSNRHRSKFNKGTKQKSKKTKKKKDRNRNKPGSQEELNSLVFTMKTCCPNGEYAHIITQTIRYLIQVKELTLASEVFQSYNKMRENISSTQSLRIECSRADRIAAETRSRVVGEVDDSHLLIEIPIEKEVDELTCAELKPSLVEFFDYLPIL